MHQPSKWFWGLIPIVILWLLAGVLQTGKVEQDLGARSASTVGPKGILSPDFSVKGRDVTVSGTRLAENAAEIVNTIGAVEGVRLVRDNTKVIDQVSPYRWSLKRDGDKIELTGNVPDPAVRGMLLSVAGKSFPGVRITDQTTYARGKSGDLGKLAASAFGAIIPLAKGNIDIVDGIVSVSGEALNTPAYNAALAAVKSIPAGALGKMEILPRLAAPFTFDAVKSHNQVVLSGFYPDEQTHAGLLAYAKSRFFGSEIVDKMELGRGAPTDFLPAASFGLGQLSRLETGTLSMSGNVLDLKGIALFDKAAQQIKAALASALPKGFTGNGDLSIKQALASSLEASACQTQLMDIVGRGRILFDTGDTKIDEASYGLLDALVFVASNCSASQIIVTGHTDSVGQPEANLDLSKRRAQAVANYLIASGVAEDRIEVVGLGQTKPVASNDTEEGRSLNRRIEFAVQ